MSDAEIQRWTREVADDPGAPSFVRLARAYRRQGRRDAARGVVERGLARNPEHLDAHSLLALIHLEEGDRERAKDEWETVIALEPDRFDARRGLGFLALERGDLDAARRHLQAAARLRPDEPTVSQAWQVLERREGRGARQAKRAAGAPRDPGALFEPLAVDAPFLGALVLDAQGLVLAGGLRDDAGRGELLGALVDAVVDEARRAARLVRIGGWQGLLLDCEGASLHLAPLDAGGIVVLAARTGAPAGWVLRAAERARELAADFMEAG